MHSEYKPVHSVAPPQMGDNYFSQVLVRPVMVEAPSMAVENATFVKALSTMKGRTFESMAAGFTAPTLAHK